MTDKGWEKILETSMICVLCRLNFTSIFLFMDFSLPTCFPHPSPLVKILLILHRSPLCNFLRAHKLGFFLLPLCSHSKLCDLLVHHGTLSILHYLTCFISLLHCILLQSYTLLIFVAFHLAQWLAHCV